MNLSGYIGAEIIAICMQLGKKSTFCENSVRVISVIECK